MNAPMARLGDTSTHGGQIVTSARKVLVAGKPVARLGDVLSCPRHGLQPIVSGADRASVEGAPIARLGDVAACGAMICPGSERVMG